MTCKAAQYKTFSQLFAAILFSMLLASCGGGSSSNSIDDADIECGGSGETTINGQNVCPDE